MLDGCLEWQKIGLAAPKIVTDATDEYFNDQDVMKQWLEDCTVDGGQFAFTPTSQLFTSWKNWCDERNLKPGNGKSYQTPWWIEASSESEGMAVCGASAS